MPLLHLNLRMYSNCTSSGLGGCTRVVGIGVVVKHHDKSLPNPATAIY